MAYIGLFVRCGLAVWILDDLMEMVMRFFGRLGILLSHLIILFRDVSSIYLVIRRSRWHSGDLSMAGLLV